MKDNTLLVEKYRPSTIYDCVLPQSLKETIKDIGNVSEDEMYKVFHWYKNDEWEKFLGATTQWDLDTYLDCLP